MTFFGLTGQTAIVTGAATGIGEAVSFRLARAGAFVFVADIDHAGASAVAQRICEETGAPSAQAASLDVTSAQSAEACVCAALDATGRLDILVNNAGIAGRAAPLWEQTEEEWRRVLAVNLDGVFHCSRAAIVPMRSRRYGRIVNIASIAGKEGNPNMTAYSSSKAAVIAFTKSLAKEVAQEGICVNSVTPAVVRTKLLDQVTAEQVDYMVSRIPMHRTGTPEEIAAVVHFLSSPDCSFVTGQCYDASGGRATY